MNTARTHEPLNHGAQESTRAGCGLDRLKHSQVTVRRVADKIEDHLNDPSVA
jgi:hypothetical protein